jgi:glycine cleavage system regulatory protein
VPEERAEELAAALRGLDARGLRVIVESAGAESDARTPRVRLDLVGLDRPGIVREIASALAARAINGEELESRTSSAPMSGETLFHVHAWLRIPTDAAAEELRTALEKLAGEMMVELHLSDDAES